MEWCVFVQLFPATESDFVQEHRRLEKKTRLEQNVVFWHNWRIPESLDSTKRNSTFPSCDRVGKFKFVLYRRVVHSRGYLEEKQMNVGEPPVQHDPAGVFVYDTGHISP